MSEVLFNEKQIVHYQPRVADFLVHGIKVPFSIFLLCNASDEKHTKKYNQQMQQCKIRAKSFFLLQSLFT